MVCFRAADAEESEERAPARPADHECNILRVAEETFLPILLLKSSELAPIRKYLAVHATELALEPNFQILRRHRRSLPPCLEHAHRSAVKNHVQRAPRSGSRRSLNLRVGISPWPALRSTRCWAADRRL